MVKNACRHSFSQLNRYETLQEHWCVQTLLCINFDKAVCWLNRCLFGADGFFWCFMCSWFDYHMTSFEGMSVWYNNKTCNMLQTSWFISIFKSVLSVAHVSQCHSLMLSYHLSQPQKKGLLKFKMLPEPTKMQTKRITRIHSPDSLNDKSW